MASLGTRDVTFIGRWYDNHPGKTVSWGPHSFQTTFTGSSSIAISLSDASSLGELSYTCTGSALGGAEKVFTTSQFQAPLAVGLQPALKYTLNCGRNDEASYGTTTVSDVLLQSGGTLLKSPLPPKALRYMAIGDSITAGFKALIEPGTGVQPSAANEDLFKTYGRHLADAWGASDWHVVARSGIAATSYDPNVKTMDEQFPCRDFTWGGTNCPAQWDFSNWQADVVTINLGTNDFTFGSPTTAQFQAAYETLIDLVRSKYGKNTLIFGICPTQYSCGGGGSKWTQMRDGVMQAIQSKVDAGDQLVRYVPTGDWKDPWLTCATEYSDYTHPTVTGHAKLASKLLETLTYEVRKIFPGKCPGTGTTCGDASSALELD